MIEPPGPRRFSEPPTCGLQLEPLTSRFPSLWRERCTFAVRPLAVYGNLHCEDPYWMNCFERTMTPAWMVPLRV